MIENAETAVSDAECMYFVEEAELVGAKIERLQEESEMNIGAAGPVMVFEIERDAAKELKTEQRRVLAGALLGDARVLGAWLAIENEGLKYRRLERLQVAVAAEDASDGDRVILPVIERFGAENRMRLYYSWFDNPRPDVVPRSMMERLGLPYSWNRYVTLGEVFKLPPALGKPSDG